MKLIKPVVIEKEISNDLRESFDKYYKNLQLYNTGINKLIGSGKMKKNPWLESAKKIGKLIHPEGMGGNGISLVELEINGNNTRVPVPIFIKATHILDPVIFMKGNYKDDDLNNKVNEPMNKAYVDAIACYAVGKIRELDYSPHFCEYYGSFSAVAEKYYYDMSDEYDSFKHKRWFWKNKESGKYNLKILSNNEPISDDIKDFFEKPTDSELYSDSESDNDTESDSSKSKSGDIIDLPLGDLTLSDDESIHSAEIDFKSVSESETSDCTQDEFNIYAEFDKFPVMLICMEKNENTMDDILMNEEYDEGWEERWMAWIFQIVIALIQVQEVLNMTHNDLHTNNILWVTTEERYLYYKENSGQVWRVPTFGKIFRIIDFGRSIFTMNGQLFYSDDFLKGNDAADQYNFGPFFNPKRDKIEPNYSFDLSRLATGLYEGLFEDYKPGKKEGGKLLSTEDCIEVWETDCSLHDMLWTWLLDDDGKNILIKANGDERFPGFDLYQHISLHVHSAKPSDQLRSGWFSSYRVKTPVGVKIYPLYV